MKTVLAVLCIGLALCLLWLATPLRECMVTEIPCAVPQWDRPDHQTSADELQARVQKRMEMMRQCEYAMHEAKRSK